MTNNRWKPSGERVVVVADDDPLPLGPEFDIPTVEQHEPTIDTIRQEAYFDQRNYELLRTGRAASHAAQAVGASYAISSGIHVRGYHDSKRPMEVSRTHRETALARLKSACASCALREFCELRRTPEELVDQLIKDRNKRRRFAKRVDPKNGNNNHLCVTNLQPGNLNDTIA